MSDLLMVVLPVLCFAAGFLWSRRRPDRRTTEGTDRETPRCRAPAFKGAFVARCAGLADPRCDGELCTQHCAEFCAGRCWRLRPNGAKLAALPGGKDGAA